MVKSKEGIKEDLRKEFQEKMKKLLGEDVFLDVTTAGEIEKFSSGSPNLDRELKGGFPKGKIVEASGGEGTGKTTSAIEATAQFQKKYPDELVLWVDLEKVYDNDYTSALGVNTDPSMFKLVRPSNGEDAWTLMIEFAKNHQGGLMVLDSVTLLLPIKEDEGDMGDAQMAAAARMNSQGFRKLMPHLSKNNTTFFAINQLRTNIGGYGASLVTTGGKGWGYYSRTRLVFSRRKPANAKEVGLLDETIIKLAKANYGNRDAEVKTRILYGEGFDAFGDIVDTAVDLDVITKAGSWFSYGDTKIGQGRQSVMDLLHDNLDLFEEIKEKIYNKVV